MTEVPKEWLRVPRNRGLAEIQQVQINPGSISVRIRDTFDGTGSMAIVTKSLPENCDLPTLTDAIFNIINGVPPKRAIVEITIYNHMNGTNKSKP